MKIVIIGGGIVGASLAIAISNFSKNLIEIELIEQKTKDQLFNIIESRTIIFSYTTYKKLNEIGLWFQLKKYVHPIIDFNFSEYESFFDLNIKSDDYLIPAFGYTIKLRDMNFCIFNILKNKKNVSLYYSSKVVDIKYDLNYVYIKLDSGISLSGNLLISAHGSDLIQNINRDIIYIKKKYRQYAIIANILTQKYFSKKAFEIFIKNDLISLFPMKNQFYSLIWSHSMNKNDFLVKKNNFFLTNLEKYLEKKLGKIKLIENIHFVPLFYMYAKKIISHRLVLIGNAAQTLHPIGAQGFNLSMQDIVLLSNIISNASKNGKDIGEYIFLNQYQEQRHCDRMKVLFLIDQLVSLLINKNFFSSIYKKLLFFSIQNSSIVQDFFVYFGLGWKI
ncbi:MAG: FAD-dependent monooxygenase [Arsenophonus sp.]|nr:MAG: FAD-dependent monooxygenase [Arsenophonus sp.]